MFSLHDFVMDTILSMCGKEPEYKVRQYALGWYDKAQLTADDMCEIENALNPSDINETENTDGNIDIEHPV